MPVLFVCTGTHDYHVGDAPDRGHLRCMERLCALEHQHKLKLFRYFAGLVEADDPDP